MPRHYPWLVTALVFCAACGGGGGGGESDSAGAILQVVQPAPPAGTTTTGADAPAAQVAAAAIHYQGERDGRRTVIGRGGRPIAQTTVSGAPVTALGIFDFITAPFDLFSNIFGGGGGGDGNTGTSIGDFFPAGPDDEWTYLGDSEVLQGADPTLLFGLSIGDPATWDFTLVAQKDGLYFSEQEVAGGIITAEPKLLWIPSDLHDRAPLEGGRTSEATLTYTPSQGSPRTAHIKRAIVLAKRGPHATLHSYFDDVLVFWITDTITRSDGSSTVARYELYLARDFGPVECAVREEPFGEIVRRTEIVRATIGGRDLPDTDDDGIVDADDRDDDNDGIPDDHLGSATPGADRCTTDTVDCDDALPKDPTEQADFDGDGLGNRSDPDADGDGVGDDGDDDGVRHDHPCVTMAVGCDDAFPLDPGEWADADGDGTGNIADPDDDNDGVADVADACPYTPDPCADAGAPPPGVVTRIATTGDPSPDGLGYFVDLGSPDLNDDGTVVFAGHFTTDPVGEAVQALLLAQDGALTTVALQGQPLPGGPNTLVRIGGYAVNDPGQVAFSTDGADASQAGPQNYRDLFRSDGGLLTEMGDRSGYFDVAELNPFPGLISPLLNNRGEVAFWKDGTIYRSDGVTLTPIAFDGQADPSGGGSLDLNTTVPDALNESGQVAFESARLGEPAPVPLAIFRGDGETLTTIVTQGDPVQADGSEILTRRLGPLHLNDSGQVAFRALVGTVPAVPLGGRLTVVRGDGNGVTTISGGIYEGIALNDAGQVVSIGRIDSTGQEAILVADDTGAQEIVRQGEAPPAGDGTFGTFQFGIEITTPFGCDACLPSVTRPLPGATVPFAHLALTDHGTVMFRAALAGTPSGMDDDQGVYLGDPHEVLQVVRHGDPLAGSAVEYILAFQPTLNRHGQVAYRVKLVDGREGVFLFTPRLHWRASGDGGWDDHTNWTVGLTPGAPHPVFITPPDGLTVTGPAAPVIIDSLTIGAQQSGTATLALQAGRVLTVTHGVTVEQAGALTGTGTLVADVSNAGEIAPGPPTGRVTVDGDYAQGGSGRLVVDIDPSDHDHLDVTGAATLGGALAITVNGFRPNPGDTFPILAADGGVTGGFTTLSGLDLGNGIVFEVHQTANAVVLVATEP